MPTLIARLLTLAALIPVALLGACGGDKTTTETAAAPACRKIDHELGTACVPKDPKRIVLLDNLLALPVLLEADVPVVGSLSVYPAGDPFPDFLGGTEDIKVVGTLQEPNLEKIAAAKPDLLIGSTAVIKPLQKQLEAIAPTVATIYSYYNPRWRDDALLVADAAGVKDKVKQNIAALDARIEATKKRLTATGKGPELSRVDVYAGDPIYYQFACTAFGNVLLGAGIRQPKAQVRDCKSGDYNSTVVTLSPEEIGLLDAAEIVAYQQQTSANEVGKSPLKRLETFGLWRRLDAVKANNVEVVGDAWGLGVSPGAFNLVLDDIDRIFP